MRSPLLALVRDETVLLLRNKTVAVTSLVLPVAIGLMLVAGGGGPDSPWSVLTAHLVLFALAFTVYFSVTAALTSRREDLYLKRLCSTATPTPVVLAGMLLPAVLTGFGQIAVLVGFAVAAGSAVPNLLLLLVAAVGGAALCVAAGLATSGLTSSAEQAQITTLPLFLALFAGGAWVTLSSEVTPPMLLVPGSAIADLVRRSLTGEPLAAALPAVAALVGWTLVAAYLARRWFRFQPR